jgi:hypothetical protein
VPARHLTGDQLERLQALLGASHRHGTFRRGDRERGESLGSCPTEPTVEEHRPQVRSPGPEDLPGMLDGLGLLRRHDDGENSTPRAQLGGGEQTPPHLEELPHHHVGGLAPHRLEHSQRPFAGDVESRLVQLTLPAREVVVRRTTGGTGALSSTSG